MEIFVSHPQLIMLMKIESLKAYPYEMNAEFLLLHLRRSDKNSPMSKK